MSIPSDESRERKTAALILASGYPPGVGALDLYLESVSIDVFIHVDQKVSEEPFRQAVGRNSNAKFSENRVKVFWRGFSMVQATIGLITMALSSSDYEYFLFLSDDSVPLIHADILASHIREKREFLQAGPTNNPEFVQRYAGYYMFDSQATQVRWLPLSKREVDRETVAKLNRLDSLRLVGKKPLTLFHGSQWWALSRESIDIIIRSWHDDPWLRESFEFSEVPDEHYFHTLLGNRGRHTPGVPFVHTEWNVETPPRIFRTVEELRSRQGVGAPFIRKARLDDSELETYIARLLAN